jgi:hypothetical protein
MKPIKFIERCLLTLTICARRKNERYNFTAIILLTVWHLILLEMYLT